MDGMDVMVLDNNFNVIGIVDDYQSLIWTERYNEAGDFQLDGDLYSTISKYCKPGYYAKIGKSDTLMIIENIEANEQPKTSNKITIKGRSIDTILERRVLWEFVTTSGKVQSIIKKLITENAIEPVLAQRKIPNLYFVETNDPYIDSKSLNTIQFENDNLYETIQTVCKSFDIGYKMKVLGNSFAFGLYYGVDRSYKQTTNPYVIFSEEYDNISESRYQCDRAKYKNVALVGGAGDGDQKFRVVAGDEASSGLDRFEMYLDSGLTDNNGEISPQDYAYQVMTKGNEALKEAQKINTIDGKIVPDMFRYGIDYNMGDILQYKGIMGTSSPVRITEFIRCLDASGYKEYPSYILLEGGNKNV